MLNGTRARDRISIYPAVQISRQISGNVSARASYAKRIRRPSISDLSPVILYSDDQSTWTGNPLLEHADVHLFELGTYYQVPRWETGLDFFYRQIRNGWQNTASLAGDSRFLYMPVNMECEHVAGFELVFNAFKNSRFRINGSGSFFVHTISHGDSLPALRQSGSKCQLSATYNISNTCRISIDG